MFTLQRGVGASVVWSVPRHDGSAVVSVLPHPSLPKVLSVGRDGALAVTDTRTSRLTVYVDALVPERDRAVLPDAAQGPVGPLTTHPHQGAPATGGGGREGGWGSGDRGKQRCSSHPRQSVFLCGGGGGGRGC